MAGRNGRAALGLLRPLRGSDFALGQPDRFATGEFRRDRKVGRGVPPSRGDSPGGPRSVAAAPSTSL